MKLSPRYEPPAVLTIDGRPDDQAVVVARQRRRMEALLAELTDDQWSTPSRCDGWTVQDVVAHLVGVNAFWAASVNAGLAGTPTRVLATFDPAAHPPLMIEPMRTLAPREVFDQFVASNDNFLGALAPLDDAQWSMVVESPPGHVSIRLLAQHALWDVWVHERDISIPLELGVVEEPDEVASCLRYAAAVGPVLTIVAGEPFLGSFGVAADDSAASFTLTVGESVEVRDVAPGAGTPCLRGAAPLLVEALSVRVPLPAEAPREWRSLVGLLATVFDTTST